MLGGFLLPRTPTPPDEATFEWSGRVWSQLTQQQCAGVLWIALRYDQATSPPNVIAYIDTMSQLAWRELGRNLQHDLCATFKQLLNALGQR